MDNHLREHEACKPFVVGRHNVPWRAFRGGVTNHVFVGVLVVVPAPSLLYVPGGEFPVFLGLFQARKKAFLLFLLREMEEEFANHGAVPRHVLLKASNVLEAFVPQVLRNELVWNSLVLQQLRMDPDDEHLFVIRPIEDTDVTTLRQTHGRAPEKIVLQLLRRRLLEGVHLATLRIDARHNVLDRAVLPGGVHRLKD